MKVRICAQNEWAPGSVQEVRIGEENKWRNVIVLRHQHSYFAYLNSCPHTGVTLNWGNDQFFDLSGTYLQCAMHGALFEPSTGYCVWGPCHRQYLLKVPVTVEDGEVYVEI